MEKLRKEHLDSLWVGTDVYVWLELLSKGKRNEASHYMNELQYDFEKKYGDAAVACGKYVFWKGKEIARLLAKELKSWDKYVEYMETFGEKMNAAMYETDIFDSYMAKHLA
ncbi:hypothetical protein [Mediterraneibacter massiliensis]|uniref:hypothetical protein n=1 Tax=Mediterraneibacter massiliensis TaxID=1720300 RepID=UPI0022E59D44|nr:hypothetical protein [Mediterraneibacter massiliensis]